jgi:hypothetical protein
MASNVTETSYALSTLSWTYQGRRPLSLCRESPGTREVSHDRVQQNFFLMRSILDHPLRDKESRSRPYSYVLPIVTPASVEFLVKSQNQVVDRPAVYISNKREVLRLQLKDIYLCKEHSKSIAGKDLNIF